MFWTALLLGVVEGLSEFVPVSSTGHLILTAELIGFEGRRAELFMIFIQLGAILSVVWEFRARLFRVAAGLPASRSARNFVLRLGLAFAPSVVVGLLLHEIVVRYLFTSATVALALIVGGVLILIVEARPRTTATHDVDALSWRQALAVGLAQCVALLWPGFSRSAATILGGLTAGLGRRTATEFSFLLGLPTMFAASGYSLLKSYHWLRPEDLTWLAVAFGVSFVVAWGSVRWLLHFVSNHSFRIFAWYRIALGLVILLALGAHNPGSRDPVVSGNRIGRLPGQFSSLWSPANSCPLHRGVGTIGRWAPSSSLGESSWPPWPAGSAAIETQSSSISEKRTAS